MRILRSLSAAGLCLALFQSVLLSGPVPAGKPSAYPDWWFERDVIARLPAAATKPNPVWPADYPAADDFAVANTGQLKHFTVTATLEIEECLGSASSELTALVAAWQSSSSAEDFTAANLGQAKYVTSKVYNQLIAYGLATAYPWSSSGNAADDYALVNLGQLKRLFSFTLPPPGSGGDIDGDGLPDAWEVLYFQNIQAMPLGDPDNDGISNRAEYLAGTSPTGAATGVNAAEFALVIYSP